MTILRVALIASSKVEEILLPTPTFEWCQNLQNFIKVGTNYINFVKPVKADDPDVLLYCLSLFEQYEVLYSDKLSPNYLHIFSSLKTQFPNKEVGIVAVFPGPAVKNFVNKDNETIAEIFETSLYIPVAEGNVNAFYEKLCELFLKSEPVVNQKSTSAAFFKCFK
uniref:Uncharacterized protein n=1 Tax=Panagrolaimus sp. JU765 TaxID=591449 RepID=A0AC34RDU5_9BILA